MDKRQKLIAQIRKEMGRKTTKELLEIWVANNRHVWSEEAFEAIQQELFDRRVDIPAHEKPDENSQVIESLTVEAMKREIKRWGAVLVLIGAAQFLIKGNMYLQWGVVLVILGAVHFVVSHHSIYLIDGMLCLVVAMIDISSGKPVGWSLGAILILWAFAAVIKFVWNNSSRERQIEILKKLGRLPKEFTPEDISQIPSRISPKKVKKLIAQLKRNREWIDWMSRKDAADALGELGPMAQEAIPALEIALEDERKDVREAAAKTLEKIGDKVGGREM